MAPIGKHDVHHQCLQLVVHSTASVLFLVPIDRASSCLFTIFASTKLNLGAHQVILPHTGKACCCFPRTYGVFLFYSQLHKNILLLSPISEAWDSFRMPKLFLPRHTTQSLQNDPSGLPGLYLGNNYVIPFACFSHCSKWYSGISISFCCVKLVA